ncbi:toxic anion resistance protein [Actinopolymorpha alba]|uniref:toxic anion resistance protein n=1 Tax=Actinopolymorpha alba TaxID=533267 RepID=UPI0003751FCF|nr:toxic anion resistance protein [Actinopolymorpha alba]
MTDVDPQVGSAELVLTPPEPVAPVRPERAETLVPISEDTRAALAERASTYVSNLSALDPRSPEFAAKISDITTLGHGEVATSSRIANRMLDRSVAALAGAKGEAGDAQQKVGRGLVELRRTVEDLDPKDIGKLTGRRLLSKLPFGNSLRDFMAKYQSANVNINKIVVALRSGQDELRRDNATIQNERTHLWNTMGKLQEYAVLAEALDQAVGRKVAEVEATDPESAKALQADVLFPVRQRYQDLLTQLAVCVQGYLALDTIRRNNDELIKGVERAATTTVSALRIAVTIAQALSNQKLVIEQVDALRGTTEEIIRANADMLAAQTDDIQRIAADPAVSAETLRKSFEQIYTTIDKIDTFKVQAVTNMQATVDALRTELGHASSYLERSQSRNELEG